MNQPDRPSPDDPMPGVRKAIRTSVTAVAVFGVAGQAFLIYSFFQGSSPLAFLFLFLTMLGWPLLIGYHRNPAGRTLQQNANFWMASATYNGIFFALYLSPLILSLSQIINNGLNYGLRMLSPTFLIMSLPAAFTASIMIGSISLRRAYKGMLRQQEEQAAITRMVAEDQREAAALAATQDHDPSRPTIP